MAHMPSKSSIIERNAGMMNKSAPTGQPAMAPLMGAPLPQNGVALAAGPDNMNAQITDHQGNPQGPAKIKAGEIVFSVESIIGAGNGNYDKGAKLILGLHDKLQQHGDQLVQKQGLGATQGSPLEAAPTQGLAAPEPIQSPSNGLAGGGP